MTALPSGTVTFLFTDVEGSTRLLSELGADRYAEALAAHRRILREAFAAHGGVEVDTQGDAFFVAFARAADAVAAAASARDGLDGGRIRVRIGVHTGEPLLTAEGYVGVDVHRAARIASAAHGGQIVVSQSTRDLVPDVPLVDLGEHRLKDLTRQERLWQLGDGQFPPLMSLYRTNLPVVSWPLIGRGRELAEIVARLRSGCRLLTLTGPGGSGKTRLALQAAAELADDFPDGVFFVSLAPLREAAAAPGAIAQALELREDDDLGAYLARARPLLLLDNAEHLVGLAEHVAALLSGTPSLLVTSRAPLHLSAEEEYPVDPLADAAAVDLFVARAAAVGRAVAADATVRDICRRLDNLPLAIELAAARTKVLAPAALFQRLDRSLPLLEGGAVDAPERQRTLRATIEWSYELLGDTERAAFRRLAVFRGSCNFDGASAVADADLELAGSLVDKSLMKPVGDDRLLMLETLREFASEQLERSGEREEYERRHADWYHARILEIAPVLRGPRTAEFLAWFADEEDNLRAALDRLLVVDPEAAADLAVHLAPYWVAQGRLREGRARLELVCRQSLQPGLRARALQRLADLEGRLGNSTAAESAADEAWRLAEAERDPATTALALQELAWTKNDRGDRDEAVRFARLALDAARAVGDPRLVGTAAGNLGAILVNLGLLEEAEELLLEAIEQHRALGDRINEAAQLAALGNIALHRGDPPTAADRFEHAARIFREVDYATALATALVGVGRCQILNGRYSEAQTTASESLELALRVGSPVDMTEAIALIALAERADVPAAARLLGAVTAARRTLGRQLDETDAAFEKTHAAELAVLLPLDRFERAREAGETMPLDEAADLARSLVARSVELPA